MSDDMFESFFVKSNDNQKSLQSKITAIANEKKHLEAEVESCNKIIVNSSKQITMLCNDLDAEREHSGKMQSQVDDLTKKLKDTDGKLNDELKEKEKLTKDNSKKASLIKRLESVSATRKTDIENLTKDIVALNTEKKRMIKRIETLESEMETKIKVEKDLREKVASLEQRYDAINVTSLNFASDEIETLTKKVEELEVANKELSNTVDTLRDSNKFYVDDIASLKKHIEAKDKSLQDMEKEKCELTKKAEDLAKQNVEFARNIEGVLTQLDEQRDTVKALKDENSSLLDSVKCLNNIADEKQALEQSLKAQQEQTSIFESKVRLREAKIQILQDKLDEVNQSSLRTNDNDKQISELSTENQNLLEVNLHQLHKIEELNAKVRAHEILQKEFEDAKICQLELKKDIKAKDERIKELLLEIDSISSSETEARKRPRTESGKAYDYDRIRELETKLKEISEARDQMLEENIKQIDRIEDLTNQLSKALKSSK